MTSHLWIDTAKFDERQKAARSEPTETLTLKTSEQIDAELAERGIAYRLAFLRERGRHQEANELASATTHPVVFATDR